MQRLILEAHLPTYPEGEMAKQNATYLRIWNAFSPATDPLPGKEPRTCVVEHAASPFSVRVAPYIYINRKMLSYSGSLPAHFVPAPFARVVTGRRKAFPR